VSFDTTHNELQPLKDPRVLISCALTIALIAHLQSQASLLYPKAINQVKKLRIDLSLWPMKSTFGTSLPESSNLIQPTPIPLLDESAKHPLITNLWGKTQTTPVSLPEKEREQADVAEPALRAQALREQANGVIYTMRHIAITQSRRDNERVQTLSTSDMPQDLTAEPPQARAERLVFAPRRFVSSKLGRRHTYLVQGIFGRFRCVKGPVNPTD
jgi:hypothetical protein